jgi:hypothetical protein
MVAIASLGMHPTLLPGTNGQFDPQEGLILLVSQVEGLRCTMEPSEAQEPARGVLHIRLVRARV